jgi:hypothetical protein
VLVEFQIFSSLSADLKNDLELVSRPTGGTYFRSSRVGQPRKKLDDLPITVVSIEPVDKETKTWFSTLNFNVIDDQCLEALLKFHIAPWC